LLTSGLLTWARDGLQNVWSGEGRSGVSVTFAARSAALIFLIGGTVDLLTALQPAAAGVSIWVLAAIGVGASLAGVVSWFLPWRRWPIRATLWLIPVGLLCIALSNMASGQNPWEWSAFFIVVFAWIGICHRPGTSLWMLVPFVVAYVAPLYPTHQASAMALSSVIFVGVTCAVVGESMAWVSVRLRRAESELGVLMGNLPGMAYKCANDEQWTMQLVSAGSEALTGYAPEALMGNAVTSYGDLVWPEDRSKLWEDIQAATESGRPWTCTYRIITATGEPRWVWERGVAVSNGSGGVRMLEGFIQDVTDRHEADERLAAAATEWRQTFDAMPDSVAVLDAAGIVRRCNRSAAELAGRAFEGIVGGHCYEEFHHAAGFVEDCPHQRARVTGKAESCVLRQDGRWLRVTFQPVFDAAGSFAGGIHVASDISELKQAEQRLIDSLLQVRTLSEQTIAAIAGIVELRDPYTAGHQQRVGELAAAIAGQMGLDDDTVAGVRVAGQVHDVGKIAVPAETLNKPGRLSEMEFAVIKEHAQTGYGILRPIDFPWPVAEIVRQHHERLDGSGYPRGLCGADIFLEARILAVADVVEAMASSRPYRAALGSDAALAEVEAGSGVRYDEAVVAACQSVLARGIFKVDEREFAGACDELGDPPMWPAGSPVAI
jgi:PAS domain S-box-containing protein/putative nucleotidyltransferase with HDIG domain